MRILILVRNFLPGHHQVISGEWNVAGVAYRAYDLEGKTVGTVGCGRIGKLLLQRLKPFNCNLLYHDRVKMDPQLEKETGAKFEEDLDTMLPKCDIVVVNTPLTEKTRGMFDKDRIAKMKKGVLIVNNARGAIMDTQAVVDACSSGHIAGYSGDVWNPQPAPKDHPWRYMPNQAMTPHVSGTTIDAQVIVHFFPVFMRLFTSFLSHKSNSELKYCSYAMLRESRICLTDTSREKIFLFKIT
ncbi:hypothetical protein CISIN_1g0219951mg [Citrus sinensis]|uniref:D-isomer specific 2-hydroxyacid dehydrogenase NAD-binding domain-containing protein n=1 Tax=Citrus sinensis TaxID=2711 RepID=A0A067FS22_CITSI|nr:hypothetical protein CISIN_1g0219951mg [Citrus sinensis]